MAFKSTFGLYFHPFIIEFFWFTWLQFNIEEKMHIKTIMLLMCLEVLGERFSGRGWDIFHIQTFWIWNIDENLNMALLITAACLHYAILKALPGFQEQRPHQ